MKISEVALLKMFKSAAIEQSINMTEEWGLTILDQVKMVKEEGRILGDDIKAVRNEVKVVGNEVKDTNVLLQEAVRLLTIMSKSST